MVIIHSNHIVPGGLYTSTFHSQRPKPSHSQAASIPYIIPDVVDNKQSWLCSKHLQNTPRNLSTF